MSLALIIGCIWVILATITAFLPMRKQYPPGLALLILAPFVLGWIALVHGWWIFVVGLFAFVSMFRNPLRYLWKRLRGEQPEIPT